MQTRARLAYDRDVDIKLGVSSTKSRRAISRMDSQLERNKATLAVFPAWEKLFKNLCKTKIEEEAPEAEELPKPAIKVAKAAEPAKTPARDQSDIRIRRCRNNVPYCR